MDLSDKFPTKRARIEILPLIDCMFLLLVFFVYTMMTLTQPLGIPLNLPKAGSATAIQEESLSIAISDADEIYINNELITPNLLADRIGAAVSANPSLRVFVSGDTDARHGTVVNILDILRRLSVGNVAIQTAPAEPEEK